MALYDDRLQQMTEGKTLQQWIADTARKFDLPVDVFTRQLWQESRFDPQAVSPAGARGIAQLMPGTAQELGVTDPSDIPSSVEAAGRYLAQQRDRFGGDLNWGLAAYNAGPGNVQKWRAQGLTPEQIPFPETRSYVEKLGNLRGMGGGTPPTGMPAAPGGFSVASWAAQNLAPVDAPTEPTSGSWTEKLAGPALRVGLPVAGGIVGTALGGPVGMAIGAGLGGALGSAGAQRIEEPNEEISLPEVGIDALLSAIPSPLGGMAGKAGTSLAKRLALTGLEGAAISEADLYAKKALEGRLPSVEEALGAGGMGAAFGAGVGTPLSYLGRTRPTLEPPPRVETPTPDASTLLSPPARTQILEEILPQLEGGSATPALSADEAVPALARLRAQRGTAGKFERPGLMEEGAPPSYSEYVDNPPALEPPPTRMVEATAFTPAEWASGSTQATGEAPPPERFFDVATNRLLQYVKRAAAKMARADQNEPWAQALENVTYAGRGSNNPMERFQRVAYAVGREMPAENFTFVKSPSGKEVLLTSGKEGLSLPYQTADVYVVPERAIPSTQNLVRKLQEASGKFDAPHKVMEFLKAGRRGDVDDILGLYRHDFDTLWSLWEDDFVRNAEGMLELAPGATPDYLFDKAYISLLGHEGGGPHVGWSTMVGHGPMGRKDFTAPEAESFYRQKLDELYKAKEGELTNLYEKANSLREADPKQADAVYASAKSITDALENEALRLTKKEFPASTLIRPEGGSSVWDQFPSERADLKGEAENVMVRVIPAIKEAIEEAGIRSPGVARMYREAIEKGLEVAPGGGGLNPPPRVMPSGGETPQPKTPKPPTMTETAMEILNMPRATATSMDLSMALRQGLVATARHPIMALKNLGGAIKSAASKANYEALEAPLRDDPEFSFMVDKAGLSFSDIARKPEDAYYGSRMIRRLFEKAGAAHLDPIFASERAFTYFLNKMRFDVMKSSLRSMESLGIPTKRIVITKKGKPVEVPTDTTKKLARWTNTITGHGNYPKGGVVGTVLQGAQNLLNTVFFSPRLVISRLESLNMAANPVQWVKTFNTYAKDAPSKQAALELLLKHQGLDMAAAAGAVGLLTTGAAAALDADVEMDPRSSDFLQLRKGTTRIDLTGGFRPYFVAGARLLSGETKPQFGDARQQNRVDTLEQFGRSRFSPLMTTAYDMLNGYTYQGEDYWGPWRQVYDGTAELTPQLAQELMTTATERVGDAAMPMLIRDLWQAGKEDPVLAAAVALPAFLGAGLNTHGLKDGISLDLYEAFKEGQISPVGRKSTVKIPGVKSLTGENVSAPLPWRSQQLLQERIDKPFYERLSEFTRDERFKSLPPLGKHLILKTLMVQFATMRSKMAVGLVPGPLMEETLQEAMTVPEGLQEPPLLAAQER